MRLDKGVINLFYLPILCALTMIVMGSSEAFAATTQQATIHQSLASTDCPVLSLGSQDSDGNSKFEVSVLQAKLKAAGEDLGTFGSNHDGIDGNFGSVTEKAVEHYQSTHNDSQGNQLKQDGIVGAHTWDALGGCDFAPPHGSDQPGQSNQTTNSSTVSDSVSEPAGATGSGTFTFTGPSQLTNITLKVQDTSCNGNPVYIQIRIYDSSGTHDELLERNDGGCNASALTWTIPSYTNRTSGVKGATSPLHIDGARIRVCNEGTFTSSCTEPPNSHTNPN